MGVQHCKMLKREKRTTIPERVQLSSPSYNAGTTAIPQLCEWHSWPLISVLLIQTKISTCWDLVLIRNNDRDKGEKPYLLTLICFSFTICE